MPIIHNWLCLNWAGIEPATSERVCDVVDYEEDCCGVDTDLDRAGGGPNPEMKWGNNWTDFLTTWTVIKDFYYKVPAKNFFVAF